jgi:hypothetical protein
MPDYRCDQCGAVIGELGTSCADRFDVLLALDHSRTEPWGSRHGLAFSAYTLQHPDGQSPETLDRCWTMLRRVHEYGEDRAFVARAFRASAAGQELPWAVDPLPHHAAPPRSFATTIAILGDFDAERYADELDAWCRATLGAWTNPRNS